MLFDGDHHLLSGTAQSVVCGFAPPGETRRIEVVHPRRGHRAFPLGA